MEKTGITSQEDKSYGVKANATSMSTSQRLSELFEATMKSLGNNGTKDGPNEGYDIEFQVDKLIKVHEDFLDHMELIRLKKTRNEIESVEIEYHKRLENRDSNYQKKLDSKFGVVAAADDTEYQQYIQTTSEPKTEHEGRDGRNDSPLLDEHFPPATHKFRSKVADKPIF